MAEANQNGSYTRQQVKLIKPAERGPVQVKWSPSHSSTVTREAHQLLTDTLSPLPHVGIVPARDCMSRDYRAGLGQISLFSEEIELVRNVWNTQTACYHFFYLCHGRLRHHVQRLVR